MTDTTLGDLGERYIVETVLAPRYAHTSAQFGDDCAVVPIEAGARLVATTDPCPPPMAEILGHTDQYFRGWLLSTINLSDLAAAGASPVGLLTSLVLTPQMLLSDTLRLLDGIDQCCAEQGTAVIGGNLKEGIAIDVQATALGTVIGPSLSRSGARSGDAVLLIGPAGDFWAGALCERMSVTADSDRHERLLRTVLTPHPQLAFGQALLASGIRCAVMDNSDGLAPSLATLARTNGIGISVLIDDLEIAPDVVAASAMIDVDPARLLFGWGDWNLVVTVDPSDTAAVKAIATSTGALATEVGRADDSDAVTVERGGVKIPLTAPDSERFVPESWFTAGIDGYIELLLGFPLPE